MTTKFICSILTVLAVVFSLPVFAQVQVGVDIDGVTVGEQSGSSVSISDDGTRVAIGAPVNDENGTAVGQVRVYEINGGNWIQLGSDINGINSNDRFGTKVSLSSNGNRLAVSAHLNDGNGTNAGSVWVYELQAGNWVQLGSNLIGVTAGDLFGWSIELSNDGNRLAVSAIENNGSSYNAGQVKVFQWNNGNWTQLGNNINGESQNDNSGESVSFSADGNRLAIGAIHNGGGGYNSGHVRIYQFNGNSWTKLGADIDGEGQYDRSGVSVGLSADGNRVAIGAYANTNPDNSTSGHVRVFEWSGASWTQIGMDIDGSNGGGFRFGWSLSLSSDGNRVAIGAFLSTNIVGTNAGNVQVYDYENGNWGQVYNNIYGEAATDESGQAIAMTADGNFVAIGARNNDDNGNNAGHVRVYELIDNCTNTSSTDDITVCGSYQWIDGNTYNESNNTATYTTPNALGCDSIISLNLTINEATTEAITESVCSAYTLNNQTYTSSGIYNQTLSNALGCDSIIILDLTINESTTKAIVESTCAAYTLNNQTYTSSGIYSQTLSNALGCDSIISLDLTINESTMEEIIESACDTYTLNGQTYNASGIYNQTLDNALGCDSTITLDLTITTIDTEVIQINDELTATITDVSYQWIDCDNNQVIEGANQQTFTPDVSGNYAVEITNNSCTEISDCFNVILSSIQENNFPSSIMLFPNPVLDIAQVDLGNIYPEIEVEIFNILGERIFSEKIFNTNQFIVDASGFPLGNYMVSMKTKEYKAILLLSKN